jgi:hypothetical protein
MKTWSTAYATSVRAPDYLGDLWAQLTAYYSAGGGAAGPGFNFERALGDLVALANWLKPAPHGNALKQIVGAPNLPPGLVFTTPHDFGPSGALFANVSVVMRELAIHIRSLSRGLSTSSPQFTRYVSLLDGLRNRFEVGIYNLNYDNVALSAWPAVFTGFDASGKFGPSAVHARLDWDFLYHLHGSIHHSLNFPFGGELIWKQDLAGTFDDGGPGHSTRDVSDGKGLPKTTLIAGGFKLDQLLMDPFLSFYSSLIRHIHSADAILLGGYGFGDTHVNAVLSKKMEAGTARNPVMILDWSQADPMEFRADRWSFELCRTLNASSKDFAEPGTHSPPDIPDLVARKGFEVNGPQQIAIWHGGFTAAAERVDEIASWLERTVGDDALAGI